MKSYTSKWTVRDKLQVTAFKSIFKANPDLEPDVRFAYAVVATCDEALDLDGKKTLIQEWARVYGQEINNPKPDHDDLM